MIEKNQAQTIKKKLISQIEKSIQEPQKSQLITQIKKMSIKELEEFLKQNNLLRDQTKCIFCSIIDNEIPTHKISENNYAIATLEINPISKGHTLIIPKIHSKDIPKQANDLASEVAQNLKFLKPKSIEVIPSIMFDHAILNILPVYNNETLESKRNPTNEKTLKELQEKITQNYTKLNPKEPPKKESKKKEIISDKTHWLPKRIP